ncbi:ACP S-malonyltransferase [Nitrogeniibacter aestuarii]|uniref:ACP S-malonyltransferase n=1 Tax=Nitrogeniibacter aestuarii TaxID=2815343 RepID=UPI0022392CB4|nr:ACP S-malonyltransferase [Nitrogeniibacter aestuarii]
MKFALVFPGQGSQSVGMMTAYGDNPVIRDTFAEASDALGEDLWAMVNEGPAERLALTVNTQPLMLTAGVAVWRAWQQAGGATPSFVAGHSLGEYSALVAAGAIAFADAVPLVRFRAAAMQDAVPEGQGAMAALLGLDVEVVEAVCAKVAQGEVVSAANMNANGQIVIAGSSAAVERAMEEAKAQGAKRAVKLPVSAPFHCALMKPAAEKLAERLADIDITTPSLPVINNVDVSVCDDPALIREALVRQAYSPVRWIETIESLGEMGVEAVIECGPGKILSGLTKRIVKTMQGAAVTDADSMAQAIELAGGKV